MKTYESAHYLIFQLQSFNPFSAWTDFISQNLTYKDVTRTERIEFFPMSVDP